MINVTWIFWEKRIFLTWKKFVWSWSHCVFSFFFLGQIAVCDSIMGKTYSSHRRANEGSTFSSYKRTENFSNSHPNFLTSLLSLDYHRHCFVDSRWQYVSSSQSFTKMFSRTRSFCQRIRQSLIRVHWCFFSFVLLTIILDQHCSWLLVVVERKIRSKTSHKIIRKWNRERKHNRFYFR